MSSDSSDSGSDRDYGGYVSLAPEEDDEDVTGLGVSPINPEVQLAEAQLMALERDYQRTLQLSQPQKNDQRSSTVSRRSFLYDTDSNDDETDEEPGTAISSAHSDNCAHALPITTTNPGIDGRKVKQKVAKKTNKDKVAKAQRHGAQRVVNRRNKKLLEEATIDLMLQRLSGGGSDDCCSSSSTKIKEAMHGFKLSGIPRWAQSHDISQVIAEYCDQRKAKKGDAGGTSGADAGDESGVDGATASSPL